VSSDHAGNSPQVIDISFEVGEAAPAIEVEPRALGFSMSEGEGTPAPQTVTVTNVGVGELTDLELGISYVDGEPTGWLHAELASTTAPTALTLRVDPEGLTSPIVLDGVVEITSHAAPESMGVVQVRFRLGEPSRDEDPGPVGSSTEIRADLKAIEDANPGSDLADEIEDVREEVEEAYSERCVKSPPTVRPPRGTSRTRWTICWTSSRTG
jgi:hypothetical protein